MAGVQDDPRDAAGEPAAARLAFDVELLRGRGRALAPIGWRWQSSAYDILVVVAWWPAVLWGAARGDRRGLWLAGALLMALRSRSVAPQPV